MRSRQRGEGGIRDGRAAAMDDEWVRFGRRVEELRESAGLDHTDLVMREVCDVGTLRRIEAGSSAPPRHLAEYLDDKLNAQGSLINAWARSLLNTHLFSGEGPYELDFSVGALREFHPGAIPPPFQTHAYATALGRAQGKLRNNRPLGRNHFASLRVVINESAMRAPVGGVKVMREQLNDLITFARGDRIRLQIIPTDVAEHPCPMGPFRLLSLGPVYTVVHLPSPVGEGQLITRPDQVHAFTDLFEDLRGAALPVGESLDLLVHIAESLKPQVEQKAITRGAEDGGALATLSPNRVAHH